MKPQHSIEPARAQRCNCYHGHDSASGRCRSHQITDPTRNADEDAICCFCRKECPAGRGERPVAPAEENIW